MSATSEQAKHEQQGPDRHDVIARSLAEAVQARYGERLSAESLETVTKSIGDQLRAAETLRKYTLANADEPDFIFRPYRKEP